MFLPRWTWIFQKVLWIFGVTAMIDGRRLPTTMIVLVSVLLVLGFRGVNEASTSSIWSGGVAAMKHSLRSREAKRTSTSPWAEGSLHKAKPCFIFHAPQVRFIFIHKNTKSPPKPRASTKLAIKSRRSRVWNPQLICGMESRQSLVWNHHGVMYVINPKEKYTLTRDAIRLRRLHTHLRWDYMPILRIG